MCRNVYTKISTRPQNRNRPAFQRSVTTRIPGSVCFANDDKRPALRRHIYANLRSPSLRLQPSPSLCFLHFPSLSLLSLLPSAIWEGVCPNTTIPQTSAAFSTVHIQTRRPFTKQKGTTILLSIFQILVYALLFTKYFKYAYIWLTQFLLNLPRCSRTLYSIAAWKIWLRSTRLYRSWLLLKGHINFFFFNIFLAHSFFLLPYENEWVFHKWVISYGCILISPRKKQLSPAERICILRFLKDRFLFFKSFLISFGRNIVRVEIRVKRVGNCIWNDSALSFVVLPSTPRSASFSGRSFRPIPSPSCKEYGSVLTILPVAEDDPPTLFSVTQAYECLSRLETWYTRPHFIYSIVSKFSGSICKIKFVMRVFLLPPSLSLYLRLLLSLSLFRLLYHLLCFANLACPRLEVVVAGPPRLATSRRIWPTGQFPRWKHSSVALCGFFSCSPTLFFPFSLYQYWTSLLLCRLRNKKSNNELIYFFRRPKGDFSGKSIWSYKWRFK